MKFPLVLDLTEEEGPVDADPRFQAYVAWFADVASDPNAVNAAYQHAVAAMGLVDAGRAMVKAGARLLAECDA